MVGDVLIAAWVGGRRRGRVGFRQGLTRARASSLELAKACDRALDADGVLREILVAEVVPSTSEDDLFLGSEVAEALEAIGRVGGVAGQLCEALNALVVALARIAECPSRVTAQEHDGARKDRRDVVDLRIPGPRMSGADDDSPRRP